MLFSIFMKQFLFKIFFNKIQENLRSCQVVENFIKPKKIFIKKWTLFLLLFPLFVLLFLPPPFIRQFFQRMILTEKKYWQVYRMVTK